MNPDQLRNSEEENLPERLFDSIEEQKAFEQIDAETMPRKGAIEQKKI